MGLVIFSKNADRKIKSELEADFAQIYALFYTSMKNAEFTV